MTPEQIRSDRWLDTSEPQPEFPTIEEVLSGNLRSLHHYPELRRMVEKKRHNLGLSPEWFAETYELRYEESYVDSPHHDVPPARRVEARITPRGSQW